MSTPASELPLDAAPAAQINERLWPALTIAPLLAALADYLFWRQSPGAPFGAFFCLAGAVVTILHAQTRASRRKCAVAGGLLVLSSVATVWAISFTNIMVLVGLLAVLVGESFYADVPGGTWVRWSLRASRLVLRSRALAVVFSTVGRERARADGVQQSGGRCLWPLHAGHCAGTLSRRNLSRRLPTRKRRLPTILRPHFRDAQPVD